MTFRRWRTAGYVLAALLMAAVGSVYADKSIAYTPTALPPVVRPVVYPVVPHELGETFRVGNLGYTVHSYSGGVLAARVHNPGPGAFTFDPQWIRVESTNLEVHGPAEPTFPVTVYDGQAIEITLPYAVPAAGRVLVFSGVDAYTGYDVLTLSEVAK